MLLEICCTSLQAALLAQQAGAHRIELCTDLSVGGITPHRGLIQQCAKQLSIPVYPMIRLRGGHFICSKQDVWEMVSIIEESKSLGCKGVVLGALQTNNTIDIATTKLLVKVANGLQVTFHKSFDLTPNAMDSLQQVIDCGCHNILTAGLANSAMEGANTLQQLVKEAGKQINIIVAGGVRSSNIASLKGLTGATHFHSKVMEIKDTTPLIEASEAAYTKAIQQML